VSLGIGKKKSFIIEGHYMNIIFECFTYDICATCFSYAKGQPIRMHD
jgi:uncharacterized membrane protein